MAMKALHSEDKADKNIAGSTRKHIISRLHKAVQAAKEVVALLSDPASGAAQTDVLEARAYVYALAGAHEFEKQAEGIKAKDAGADRWNACLTNLAAARVLYSALHRATKKDLFKDVLTGTIDPSIRYAAYQNRIPRTVGVPAVAHKYFPKDEQLAKAVKEVDATALQEEEATASSRSP
jgi:signal recognition particle subunit SRP68